MPHTDRGVRPGLALALAAGALLRVPGLRRESFWLDELSAVRVATMDLHGLFTHLQTWDVHPPLYFLLLKAWTALAGAGERGARSLSVLLGLGALAATAWLAGLLGGARAALGGALLAATSPFLVYYSREARGYALLHLLTALSLGGLLQALREPSHKHLGRYGITALGLLYAHAFGALTVLAQALAVALSLRHEDKHRGRWTLTYGWVGVGFLPWLPTALRQAGRVQEGFWIAPPDPLGWLLGWAREGPLSVLYVLGLVVFTASGWRGLGGLPRERRALGGAALLPVALALGASWVGRPIFLGKYAIGSLAVLHVVAAVGLAGRGARGVLVGLLLGLGAAESVRDAHLTRHRADWRALARFAAEVSARGEGPVVLSAPYPSHLAVYLPRGVSVPRLAPEEVPALVARAPGGAWVLDVHPATTPPALEGALRCCFRPTGVRRWHRARATHWERLARPL
ncbi:MAG: glycosyltransferase family 39 protein [Deltaproteobacteria bacterium]|nr:glycosyltransferase family 39 protein [Deltaproteobacteria bacterium]